MALHTVRGEVDLGLEGKDVLVTGGTRGIGREISLSFARGGAHVTACYRKDQVSADALAGELADIGGPHRVVQADVTDQTQVAALIAVSPQGWDVVVSNAGVDGRSSVADMTPAEWHRVLDTNLTAAYLMARAALPVLPAKGTLIIIGGAVATRGVAGMAHHNAAKAGVQGLIRSLAREVGPRGIRVNAVAPGIVESEPGTGPPAAVSERLAALTSLGRLGRPDDIAGVVLFLASDLAGYLTGVSITADGGI